MLLLLQFSTHIAIYVIENTALSTSDWVLSFVLGT